MADLAAMSRVWDVTGADLNYIFLGRTDTMPHELAMTVRALLAAEANRDVDAADEINEKRAPSRAGDKPGAAKVKGKAKAA